MGRNVLLIEPNYKSKYPPMGLMKLATYYKRRGDNVRFFKGDLKTLVASLLCEKLLITLNAVDSIFQWGRFSKNLIEYIKYGKNSSLPDYEGDDETLIFDAIRATKNKFINKTYSDEPFFDLVCVTTLFTFNWKTTVETINFVKGLCRDKSKVFVGGIAASTVPNEIERETGIKPVIGILDKAGVLDEGDDTIIDILPLDYSILYEVDYKYPATDAYFAYMTRGCTNKCSFCAVPTLEPKYKDYIQLQPQLEETIQNFGEQRNLLLLDNNVLASPCFGKIVDEIKACGFGKGAKFIPWQRAIQTPL